MPYKKLNPSLFKVFVFIFIFLLGNAFAYDFIIPNLQLQQKADCIVNIFYGVLLALTSIFFLLTWLKDPGYVYTCHNQRFMNLVFKLDYTQLCPVCEVIKPLRSRHCSICNKCVERYDHHCPWVNNCIGVRNYVVFYFFALCLLIENLGCLVTSAYIIIIQVFNDTVRHYVFVNIFLFLGLDYNISCSTLCGLSIIYFGFFFCMIGVLMFVQTCNVFMGKTTYERFGSNEDGEEASKSKCSFRNCTVMCCKNTVPSQELVESEITFRHKSNVSIENMPPPYEVKLDSYHGLSFV